MAKKKLPKNKPFTLTQLLGTDEITEVLRELHELNQRSEINSIVVVWEDQEQNAQHRVICHSIMEVIGMIEWAKLDVLLIDDGEEENVNDNSCND